MIRFHKILHQNLPTSFEQNQEHVWFTDQGAIFVGDANGIPRQMGLGFQVVDTVPAGTPAAPGLMRYATSTQKYYFSTPTQWIELMTSPQAGSTGGPGYASGVIVTDVNNNFTSGDVEGALLELAESVKSLRQPLGVYNGNVFGLDDPGEWALGSASTNRPSGSPAQSWLQQRVTPDGTLLGILIDKNGKAYTRSGDTFARLADQTDITNMTDAVGSVNTALNNLNNKVTNQMKINVGPGLVISGGGLLGNNPTISLNIPTPEAPDVSGFLPTTGGNMTGNLVFKMASHLAFDSTSHNLIDMKTSQVGAVRTQLQNNSHGFRLMDATNSVSMLYWKASDRRLYINYTNGTDSMDKSNAAGVNIQAPLMVENYPIRNGDSRFPDPIRENHYAFYADNARGNLQISRGSTAAFAVRNPMNTSVPHVRLEATDQTHSTSTSMVISGIWAQNLKNLQLNADNVRVSDRLHVGDFVVIGSDSQFGTTRGKVDNGNRLVMHARTGRVLNSPNSVDQRYVAQMAFYRHERSRDEIHFNVADMGTHLYDTTGWEGHTVTVTANRFRASQFENASSIKYKENVEKYEDGALGIVENLDVFKYNYKEDEDKNQTVGFIIEEGVPEIAVTGAGDALDPYAMVAILWKAVQELKAEVNELRR